VRETYRHHLDNTRKKKKYENPVDMNETSIERKREDKSTEQI
jgi:hypothetical protein